MHVFSKHIVLQYSIFIMYIKTQSQYCALSLPRKGLCGQCSPVPLTLCLILELTQCCPPLILLRTTLFKSWITEESTQKTLHKQSNWMLSGCFENLLCLFCQIHLIFCHVCNSFRKFAPEHFCSVYSGLRSYSRDDFPSCCLVHVWMPPLCW